MTTKAAKIAFGVLLAFACPRLSSKAQDATLEEYKIKAAYIVNFAKFVEWPAEAFPTPETPLTLCVLGKDPFGSDLEKTIGDKSVAGRPWRIKRIEEDKLVAGCHVLFISSSERKRLPELFQRLKNSSVLTIGETDQFTQLGGMINLIKEENMIRFEINVEAAEKAGLKISSKLLQVGTGPPERFGRANR